MIVNDHSHPSKTKIHKPPYLSKLLIDLQNISSTVKLWANRYEHDPTSPTHSGHDLSWPSPPNSNKTYKTSYFGQYFMDLDKIFSKWYKVVKYVCIAPKLDLTYPKWSWHILTIATQIKQPLINLNPQWQTYMQLNLTYPHWFLPIIDIVIQLKQILINLHISTKF